MKIFLKYLFCLLTGTLLFSCLKNSPHEKLLNQSQDSLIMGKPDITLNLLSSIDNPEKMDKENYMQYIVVSVGAKYETKVDITKDTLIFEAQRYFNKKEDLKYTVLANYYTAQLYDESGNSPKALESYMLAANAADKSNNNLLAGKSLNNIGYIYFEQDMFDSAVVNFQKALFHYNKLENTNQRKFKTLTNIGRSYEVSNRPDSASVYFQKCLSLAEETQNEVYQFYSLKNLGVVSYGSKDYDKAIEYLESALAIDVGDQVDRLEIQKTHTALLDIYTKTGDIKSAKEYAQIVIDDLSDVKYTYTLKVMYASLADYFEQTGDYKKALGYSKLEKTTQGQIERQKDAPALLEADKNFYIEQNEREFKAFRSNVLFVIIIGASAFCILLVFFLLVWKRHKKDKAEIQFYGDKYDELRQVLYDKTDEYPKIEAEIKSMLEDE